MFQNQQPTLHLLISAILFSMSLAHGGTHPPTASALMSEAKTAWEKKDYRQTEKILSDLAKLHPDDWYARANLGAARIELGKFKAAEKDLQAAMATRPNDPFPSRTLGILYTRTGEWDKARAMFLRTLKLQPDDRVTKEQLEFLPKPQKWER